jgi:two-component system response regulator YesN
MCKVLVVDDHDYITAGISKMIERMSGSQRKVYTANNGDDAEKIAIRINPDIVFTDIRMPDISGLELISRLKKHLNKTRYIVMSGYDDFAYARDALRLGVVDYLLKPIDKEDVERLIQESMKRLEEDQAQVHAAFVENITEQGSKNTNEILLCQLFESIENVDLVQELKKEGMEFTYKFCSLITFERDMPLANLSAEIDRDENVIHIKVKRICEEYLKEAGVKHLVFSNFDNQVVAVINHKHSQMMDKISSDIILEVGKKLGISMSAGIGNPISDFSELKASYNHAKTSIKYRILFDAKSSIAYNDIKDRNKDEISHSYLFRNIITCIETGDQKGIESAVRALFHEFSNNHRFSIESLISACYWLYSYAVKLYGDQDLFTISEEDFHKKFRRLCSIQEANDFITESIKKVCVDRVRDDIYLEHKRIIGKALKYIHENYDKDISLAFVANLVSRNYTYFSKLFKNQTGLSFSHYLRNFRIEKAKELIRDTDLKIVDIAKAVGYIDYVHFCKSFTKMVGMPPNKYRESIMMN